MHGSDVEVKIKISLSQQRPLFLKRAFRYLVLICVLLAGTVPIAHVLFQNLEDFLPRAVDGLK